jgi:hypothetical protein
MAGEFIEGEGIGRVVDPRDIPGIERALRRYYEEYCANRLPEVTTRSPRSRFFREERARQLAGVLEAAAADVP